ncbi:dihydroorotate dehydrogenase-like protein [Actinocrinis puniceicyclus]|uniref:Dihydroorotate dehydrogenase-like protein n=1 Tax=Actinocrinis puniceicyclus TaxID=977794 RepID=A0A8J8BDK8_9ACTN|nr:dihydroorotate dehydrogenase-like protein [Actinocrinis puniceicyclus]MBS2964266.1 dihydroorotate dehydrogenase-like protein [Actinocrinis puniceicyclus]
MDLTTRYLGLQLRNPIVASAGPLAGTVAGVRRLADAGAAAVVLPSLFEEQLLREPGGEAEHTVLGTDDLAATLDYLPPGGQRHGPRGYLELIRKSAASVGVPVIASLNGFTTGGWTDYAAAMQEAGAAAIELNLYFPQADPLMSGQEVELRHVEVLTTVKAAVSIPVAVKIGPAFSSPGQMAMRLDHAGADGLVLFNRFMQVGVDAETLSVNAAFELSRPADAAVARAWIARLRGRVKASLAASSGVDQAGDVAAYLLAGADVVMTTSALLRHGPEHIGTLLDGLSAWMGRKGFTGLVQVRGMLADAAAGIGAQDVAGRGVVPEEQQRAAYLNALQKATSLYGPHA